MIRVKDRQITSVEPIVFLPAAEGVEYEGGMALNMGATAAKCGEAERPTHLCVGPATGKGVPAIPVLGTTRFEADYAAAPAVGAAVKLGADAKTVTAATGGAFTVVSVDEDAAVCTGYFK